MKLMKMISGRGISWLGGKKVAVGPLISRKIRVKECAAIEVNVRLGSRGRGPAQGGGLDDSGFSSFAVDEWKERKRKRKRPQ